MIHIECKQIFVLQVLLDRFGLTSMEDVFLRLSTDDEAASEIKSKASSISHFDNWGSYPRLGWYYV